MWEKNKSLISCYKIQIYHGIRFPYPSVGATKNSLSTCIFKSFSDEVQKIELPFDTLRVALFFSCLLLPFFSNYHFDVMLINVLYGHFACTLKNIVQNDFSKNLII